MKLLIAPITALAIVFGCQLIGTHITSLSMTLIAAALYSIILLSLAAWFIHRSESRQAALPPYITRK